MEKVVILTGPTGIGKTKLSLMLANKFNCEIINCDASQMKRELNIGTGKYDTSGTNIKHHLFDIIGPTENYSIKDFKDSAKSIISEISNNNHVPMIVGGTGLYINSLLFDYDLESSERDRVFEKKYQTLSNHELHTVLEKYDLNIANMIHENNRRRVLRAIERIEKGEKVSLNDNQMVYDALIIMLDAPRDVLYDRINHRVDEMIDDGWVEECNALSSKYNTSSIKDIGYQEIFSYLKGELKLEEAKEVIKQKTRNYAKRQLTWFRNKLNPIKVMVNYDNLDETFDVLSNLCFEFLNK